MFKLFKKKKKEDSKMELPPPLPPEEDMAVIPKGDLPPIIPDKGLPPLVKEDEMPELEFPEIPKEAQEKQSFSGPQTREKSKDFSGHRKIKDFPREPGVSVEPVLPPLIQKPAVEKPFPKFKEPPKVFDKTIEEAMPSKKVIKPKLKPIFVDMEEYKTIINNTNVIRSKLLEAEDFAKKLNHLKHKEVKILDKWHSRLEELDKKLTYVDKVVSKAQG